MRSSQRLQGVLKDVLSDRRSESLGIVCSRAKVNAGKDPSILYFIERFRKTVKGSNDAGITSEVTPKRILSPK
jgi:hypothetical protein